MDKKKVLFRVTVTLSQEGNLNWEQEKLWPWWGPLQMDMESEETATFPTIDNLDLPP
jgi:hypothetical protein